MDDAKVSRWLDSLGLARYIDLFAVNEIDWDILPELTDGDLEKLGIPLGPRKKLLKGIRYLGEPTSVTVPPEQPVAANSTAPEAERRQLTVVFCDLVGSTELAARLDPEDMSVILHDYQAAVSERVKYWGGHVARYMGDGLLAYFGYPRAHEDDAERAVRASIEALAEIGAMNIAAEQRLAARIGLATGLVMVGDLIGEGEARERAVIGETPNLAARLQALAKPNTVVIAPGTRALLGELFELADLGCFELKGFAEPVQVWQVLGASKAVSRFEALHAGGLTPLVGREHEIGLLLDRFELAGNGDGQVVLLCGEAGIGKSRITRALHEHLSTTPHTRLNYYCSPYHTNSAFYPIIDHLKRAIGYLPESDTASSLDKIETMFSQAGESIAEAGLLLAALCSIPVGDRYPALKLTPQAQKERTFAILQRQLEHLAARQPVLMIVEDVHWIDPTSAELFGLLIDRIQPLPVLLLMTFRPEYTPPWTGYAHVTSLTLNRLGQRQGLAIVERLTAGKSLPGEVLEQILQKTDGVPLFIEELTKMVLESGLLTVTGDQYRLAGALPALAIPTTLHDSLMARLDKLAPVKEVAQIGAVIGRDFSHKLIAAIAPMSEEKLCDALNQLAASELIFRRGQPPEARYSFKHALVQDAAYQSLLKSRLHQLHARIVEVLEAHFSDVADTQPELLAYHCSEAGLDGKAIHYWRRAGEQAARRAASLEAVQHFQKAMKLLETQPAGRERDAAELEVRIQFGPALMLAQGWASAEVGEMYRQAGELARGLEDPAALVPPLVGSWLYYQGSAQFDAADKTTAELFQVAHSLNDSDLLLQAHHAAWPIPMLRGNFTPAYEHIEQGLCLYEYERHRHDAFVYMGHDPAVCAHALGAVVAWNQGYFERSREHAENAVTLAKQLGHPPSLALALWFIGGVHAARGDPKTAQIIAEQLLTLSEEQKLVQTRASAQIIGGWALAQQGQTREGIELLQAGLAIWHRMGARHYLPPYTCLLAESFLCAGQYEQAREQLDQALYYCYETGEQWWNARIHLARGKLFLQRDRDSCEFAERSFRAALQIAQTQHAKGPELRVASSLAELWREQGQLQQVQELLGPLCDWFEGSDAAELANAKSLLDA